MKIVLMFLGGLPNPDDDSGKCWKRFLELSDKKYFHETLVTVHPIKQASSITGFWEKYLKESGPLTAKQLRCLQLKKEDDHLKTAWATRSLVDATILMIKKSYEKFPSLEKFILIDSKSCPLYNLSVLFETVTSNCDNWIDPLNNSCANYKNNPLLYCKENICIKREDCSFWSQWVILDVKYLQSLLSTVIVKDATDIQCNNSTVNQIIVPDTNDYDSKIINQSLLELLDPNDKPCNFADELYFGFYLKRGRTIEEFLNIIHKITSKKLIKSYSAIKPIKTETIFIKPVLIEHYDHYKNGVYLLDAEINKKFPYYISHIKFNDKIVDNNLYTIPSIYTDWRYFNPNPLNVFRSFNLANFNITKFLETPPHKSIALLSKLPNEMSFNSLGMNKIPYWAHPLEYNTTTMCSFVNAYNFFEYARIINPNDYYFNYLHKVYKNILVQNNVTFSEKDPCEFALLDEADLNIPIGSFVCKDTLNEARMRGCLFIRKCEGGSLIHHYADQLYTSPKTTMGKLPYHVRSNSCNERNVRNLEMVIYDLNTFSNKDIKILQNFFKIKNGKNKLQEIAKQILILSN